jgi:hypothetical protein
MKGFRPGREPGMTRKPYKPKPTQSDIEEAGRELGQLRFLKEKWREGDPLAVGGLFELLMSWEESERLPTLFLIHVPKIREAVVFSIAEEWAKNHAAEDPQRSQEVAASVATLRTLLAGPDLTPVSTAVM